MSSADSQSALGNQAYHFDLSFLLKMLAVMPVQWCKHDMDSILLGDANALRDVHKTKCHLL